MHDPDEAVAASVTLLKRQMGVAREAAAGARNNESGYQSHLDNARRSAEAFERQARDYELAIARLQR